MSGDVEKYPRGGDTIFCILHVLVYCFWRCGSACLWIFSTRGICLMSPPRDGGICQSSLLGNIADSTFLLIPNWGGAFELTSTSLSRTRCYVLYAVHDNDWKDHFLGGNSHDSFLMRMSFDCGKQNDNIWKFKVLISACRMYVWLHKLRKACNLSN